MQEIPAFEDRWLSAMREAWAGVYVGIDHHSRQFTAAAASGEQFQANQGARDSAWMTTNAFAQDGLGYVELLAWLSGHYPGVPREKFMFLSEPTFAKPLGGFLKSGGYQATQVRWVHTTEVGLYRKAKHVGKSGKNDRDDARALATMTFEAATSPHERRRLFVPASLEPVAEGLKYLARDHARVTAHAVALQSQTTALVVRVFPECRRVWSRVEKGRKPDGSTYEQQHLDLFASELPLRVLGRFPGASHVAEAGFEVIWKEVGGRGFRKQVIRDLVELAARSGGTNEPLDARRLELLIEEYRQTQARLVTYRDAMREVFEAEPVLASLQHIAYLSPQILATIVGALGDVTRFDDFDAVKRFLNLAPVPLPHSGDVDEQGRPVQRWRLPANSYKRVDNRRVLVYEHRGLKCVRTAAYVWFAMLVTCSRCAPDDPFVRLYLRLKERHQGETRWFGKVRWKVVAKMVAVIYHCLRKGVLYDPTRIHGAAPVLTL